MTLFIGQVLAYVICIPALLFGTCLGLDMLLGGISVALQRSSRDAS